MQCLEADIGFHNQAAGLPVASHIVSCKQRTVLEGKEKESSATVFTVCLPYCTAETQEVGSGCIGGKHGYGMCSKTALGNTIARQRPWASNL